MRADDMRPEIATTDRASGITRRHIVSASLGALAAPALLRTTTADAQTRIIKIGHVSPRTGPLAAFGEADAFVLDQIQKAIGNGITNGGPPVLGAMFSAALKEFPKVQNEPHDVQVTLP